MAFWTVQEEQWLTENYSIQGPSRSAGILGRTKGAINAKASKLGLSFLCSSTNPSRPWTDGENDWLSTNYPNLGVAESAKRLGRGERAVANQAWKMRLKQNMESEFFKEWQTRAAKTKVGRKRPAQAEVMRSLFREGKMPEYTKERREAISRRTKEKWATEGHPRGMLGKKHSEEVVLRVTAKVRQRWQDPHSKFNSEEYRQGASDRFTALRASETPISREKKYSRCRRGKRKDLGSIFFRSSWEANYARYLNWRRSNGEIYSWEYEPGQFKFEAEKRGVRSYTPDFKILVTKFSEPVYIEIKGWMDENSKKRLALMKTYYPEVQLEVIGFPQYIVLQHKFGHLSGWERHTQKRKPAVLQQTLFDSIGE